MQCHWNSNETPNMESSAKDRFHLSVHYETVSNFSPNSGKTTRSNSLHKALWIIQRHFDSVLLNKAQDLRQCTTAARRI